MFNFDFDQETWWLIGLIALAFLYFRWNSGRASKNRKEWRDRSFRRRYMERKGEKEEDKPETWKERWESRDRTRGRGRGRR